jgi:hypothetical protein
MSRKPEQSSGLNSLYPVLSAAAQSMVTIAGTWDICSHSQKAATLAYMEQLTVNVIEVMAENLEQHKQIKGRNN